MKIMTILGTRPEIIRLSRIIPLLDQMCDHVLVHTGQHYDPNLYDIFFKELDVRKPDYVLTCRSKSLMGQVASILLECEGVMVNEKPDRLLLLGDTNSALSAIVAKRMGIPVFHMEAGNRCFDDRVPEEVNRRQFGSYHRGAQHRAPRPGGKALGRIDLEISQFQPVVPT